jgi:ribosomal protein S21
MEVVVQNGNIEVAIEVLKKKVLSSGLFRELRRSAFFETRTQRRKTKDQMARKRAKRMQITRMKKIDGRHRG